MKRVIDTSAWIEYLLASDTGRKIAPNMPDREDTIVPTIVQMELYKWLAREKSVEIAALTLNDANRSIVVPLTSQLAVRAAIASAEHRLSAADAIIYATAREHDAELLTCDVHFNGLPGVLYFSKSL